MGYYTRHTLFVDHNERHRIIRELREKYDELKYAIDMAGIAYDETKWYNHEQVMREISLEYPDILFTLYGEGEDNKDIWKEYYLNGLMQHCNAKITFEEYDESKLK